MIRRNLFYLKRKCSMCFLTLTFPWLLLTAGLVFPRFLVTAVLLIGVGGALAVPLTRFLLWILTKEYATLDPDKLHDSGNWLIGVAGSGFCPAVSHPPEMWFDDFAILRMMEAGRIARALQAKNQPFRICVSISGYPTLKVRKMQALGAFFAMFQISTQNVVLLDTAWNTWEEIEYFGRSKSPLILVSNNWHIARIMKIAKMQGLQALPAPVGPAYGPPGLHWMTNIFPSCFVLQYLEFSLREVVGLVFLRLYKIKNNLKKRSRK